MLSEPQHKLKSFIRNSFTFNVMKHGAGSSSNSNTRANVDRKATIGDGASSRMETITKTLQQEDNGWGSDIPNSAHSSSPSIHPRESIFPHAQSEPVIMSSSRQTKKRDKGSNDDHRSHSHPFRRHSNALLAPEVPDIDKNKTSADRQNLAGVDLITEFERLRKETEVLKKTVHDHRKAMKKQAKKYEEVKNEAAANAIALIEKNQELVAKDEELRNMKDSFGKLENCISSVESSLLCQICIETLHRPYALSPCGHVFCLACLQEWFRKSPVGDHDDMEDLDNPRYVVLRPKSCPCCRTRITHRPILLFILRGVTNTLAASRAQLLGTNCRPESPIFDHDSDPWKGIFPSNDDDEESASGRRSSSHSVGADSLVESDRLSGRFTPYSDGFVGYGFESDSESEGARAPYTRDNGSDNGDIFVHPRWQPPSTFASYRSSPSGRDQESNNPTVSLLRRGCPLQMILSFHMTYSREEGIIAHVPSLVPSLFLDYGNIDIEMMHRIFLGWNIQVDEEDDRDGCAYMQQMLIEIDEYPERWEIRPKNSVPDGLEVYDARRLVRRSDIDEYSSDGISFFDGAELD